MFHVINMLWTSKRQIIAVITSGWFIFFLVIMVIYAYFLPLNLTVFLFWLMNGDQVL